MSRKFKVAWLCAKHEITKGQMESLAELMDVSVLDLEVVHVPMQWDATEHSYDDIRTNKAKWVDIIKHYDIITGVFPPVAIESLSALRYSDEDIAYSKCIFIPISSVMRVTIGGKTVKRMVFHRWMEI